MPTVADMAALVPWMQGLAARSDQAGCFPAEEVARLRAVGALSLPLPVRNPERNDAAADELADVLALAGKGNLSVGRIYEAHVNALHLIARYGTRAQWDRTLQRLHDGALYALWVTDHPDNPVRIVAGGGRLAGRKQFCSAAGHATDVLITAANSTPAQMLVLRLGRGETVTPLQAPLAGMRASVTGEVDFTGCVIVADERLGQEGDYLREPDFSAGAWRGSAVALGGLMALVDAAVVQLRRSGRLDNPHAVARLGHTMIALETARLWVRRMGRVAEDNTEDAARRVATVGLGRIAVEAACLDAMRDIQRSIGLSSFRSGSPIERICRDLATYLRQPASDEVLTEAAAWFALHPDREGMA